jgi:hypothetical protein
MRAYYSYNDDAREIEEIEAYEQRFLDIIVEDWYDLVRYLVGLGFAIFGLIGLYFHQFASYYFLKRCTNTEGTIGKLRRVLSIESMNNIPRYPLSSATVSEDNNYNDTEEVYDDQGMVDRGEVPLILLQDNPKSACTPE